MTWQHGLPIMQSKAHTGPIIGERSQYSNLNDAEETLASEQELCCV